MSCPGTVMIGEDGTLMMAEGSGLLGEKAKEEGGGGGGVFTTADGAIITAGDGNVLLDTEGNVLTDQVRAVSSWFPFPVSTWSPQDGNILTTADIGKLSGAELVGEGEAGKEAQVGPRIPP